MEVLLPPSFIPRVPRGVSAADTVQAEASEGVMTFELADMVEPKLV